MERAAQLMDRIPLPVQAATIKALYGLPVPLRRMLAGRTVRRDGNTLEPDIQLLLRILALQGMSLAGGTAIDAMRAQLDASSMLVGGTPIAGIHTQALRIPSEAGGMGARLYVPDGLAENSGLLVFYHGGGWVLGSLDSHDSACRTLARDAEVRVLSVDYRLAPEAQFPAAAEDAMTALRWARDNAQSLGVDPTAIAVGGDSAGGNLALVTAHQAARTGGGVPCFVLALYPVTDMTQQTRSRELFADGFFLTKADMDFFESQYSPRAEQRTDERLSILHASDLRGMPPTYVATAGFDPLRDEGEAMARTLSEAGVRVVTRRFPGLIHGFVNFLGLGPAPAQATAELAGALRTGIALRGQ